MPNYWTNCFDNARTGWNPEEVILTPDEIKKSFGLLYTYQVTGQVLAQPLFVAGVTAYPGGDLTKPPQTLDLVFVATEDNFIYAFDAKQNTQIWQRQLLPVPPAPSERLITPTDVNCDDVEPHYGITGTPVIDVAAGIMYLVAPSALDSTGHPTSFFQRLYAIDLATGRDRLPPAPIATFVQFYGDPNIYQFDPQWQFQRGALLLLNGVVYVPFGSHCDNSAYHGWIMAYDAATLAFVGVFVSTTPADGQGGIWQAGRGLAGDSNGSVYCAVGNGVTSGLSYGNCVLKLVPRPNPAQSSTQNYLSVQDYFAPCNTYWLSQSDMDLGSGGALLLPDQVGPGNTVRHLLVAAGKEGTIYLLNRDNLGAFTQPATFPPPRGQQCADSGAVSVLWRVLGQASTATEARDAVFGGPAYFAPTGLAPRIYYTAQDDFVRAFTYDSGSNSVIGPFMQSIDTIPNGSIPVVSSNGGFADTAVLWIVSRTDPITLSAYPAENLRARLINITVGPWIKSFAPPATVVNGRVYVAFNGGVSVFGTPLSTSTCFIATAVEGASSFRVATLRTFRDECLLTNRMGRYFVSLYEQFSPLLASMIRKSKRLRSIARGFIVLPSFLVAKGLLLIKRRK